MIHAVEIVERLPTGNEYVGLRHRVGWQSPSIEHCERALAGSLASVCAVENGAVVGMGRLVGDGRMYCFVVDVVVDPDFQRRGVGQAIMNRLEHLATKRELGMRLDLIAAPDVVAFYHGLGYEGLDSDLMRKAL